MRVENTQRKYTINKLSNERSNCNGQLQLKENLKSAFEQELAKHQ